MATEAIERDMARRLTANELVRILLDELAFLEAADYLHQDDLRELLARIVRQLKETEQ